MIENAVRASLQEDRALQQGQHFSQCPTSPEAGGRRPSLEYNINVPATPPGNTCILQTAEKRRQVCVSQRQTNGTTNAAALLEKSIILSFHFLTTASLLSQGWLSMLLFHFPIHPSTMSCDAGRCPAFLLWMGCASPSSSLPAWSPG